MVYSLFNIFLAIAVVAAQWSASYGVCTTRAQSARCCCASACQEGMQRACHRVSHSVCPRCAACEARKAVQPRSLAGVLTAGDGCRCGCGDQPTPPVDKPARYQDICLRTLLYVLAPRLVLQANVAKRSSQPSLVRPLRFYDGCPTNQLFCTWLI